MRLSNYEKTVIFVILLEISVALRVYRASPQSKSALYVTKATMYGIKKVRGKKKYFMLVNDCLKPINEEIAARCLRSTLLFI